MDQVTAIVRRTDQIEVQTQMLREANAFIDEHSADGEVPDKAEHDGSAEGPPPESDGTAAEPLPPGTENILGNTMEERLRSMHLLGPSLEE